MAYNLQKLILGGFLFFVEKGETIDNITVDPETYPDTDPAENWNSLGCVSEVNFNKETETDTDYCPSPAGGYNKEDDEVVVSDNIEFITRAHSEPYWRMLLGLNNKIVDGTAQTPFANKRRYIEGWLKIQGRAQDGADRVVMNIYGRLTINDNPKWSKDATKPALKFQKLYSSIATVEPNGIA